MPQRTPPLPCSGPHPCCGCCGVPPLCGCCVGHPCCCCCRDASALSCCDHQPRCCCCYCCIPPPHCRPLLLWCLALLRPLLCARAILPLQDTPLLLMLQRSFRAPGRLWWPAKNHEPAVIRTRPCLLLMRTPFTRRWGAPRFRAGKHLVMLGG